MEEFLQETFTMSPKFIDDSPEYPDEIYHRYYFTKNNIKDLTLSDKYESYLSDIPIIGFTDFRFGRKIFELKITGRTPTSKPADCHVRQLMIYNGGAMIWTSKTLNFTRLDSFMGYVSGHLR
ncbi:MAG: hypothetical protein OXC40_08085 [Proteobacteria bacterium]|nr:hypothetical protein [Pseudomonadota bacterium]